MAEDYSHLRAVPLFASLKNDDLAYIGSIIQQTAYPANEVIITQGDQGETFYIVAFGQVRVVRQDESGVKAVVRLLGQGQYFGEASLLYGEARSATVEASVPTTLLYIEQEDFHVMVERLPGVRKQLEAAAGRRSKVLGLDRFDWQMPDETVMWQAQRNVIPLFFESLGSLLFWHVLAAALAVVSFMRPSRRLLPAEWQWALAFHSFHDRQPGLGLVCGGLDQRLSCPDEPAHRAHRALRHSARNTQRDSHSSRSKRRTLQRLADLDPGTGRYYHQNDWRRVDIHTHRRSRTLAVAHP